MKFELVDMQGFEPNKQIPLQTLLASARILKTYADDYAARDADYARNAAWYHRSWLFLRAANSVASPTWHTDFYQTAFEKKLGELKAAGTEPRILISGTADYALPAIVLDSLGKLAMKADVTVLDLAMPPLRISNWWAMHAGHPIHTVRHDILQPPPFAAGFDIIASDAFLTRFPRDQVSAVLRRWDEMLAPGGVVVTTVRAGEPGDPATTDSDRSNFVSRAGTFFSGILHDPLSGKAVEKMAAEYVARMKSNRLGNKDEILGLFRGSAFSVISRSDMSTPGEYMPTQYLRIVAERPSGQHL